MPVLDNPFEEPILPLDRTNPKANVALVKAVAGQRLGDRQRALNAGRVDAGRVGKPRPKHITPAELLAEAEAAIERDKAREEGLALAKAKAEAELYGFSEINETEAKRLGLERVKIEGNKQAQKLMKRIFDQTRSNRFDVANIDEEISKVEIARFATEWERRVGTPGSKNYVPMPCVPGKYIGYIKALATNRIISNIETDPAKQRPSHPNFSKTKVLYMVNDWEEQDFNQDKTLQTTRSTLIRELGIKQKNGKTAEGVVNIKREQVDQALWIGDPGNKIKTPKHIELIKKLGLDQTKYNFRLISQDEYARLAGAGKNFGNSHLSTMFNGYWFASGVAFGLDGGERAYGGASYVRYVYRDDAGECLAVRLVLEYNK